MSMLRAYRTELQMYLVDGGQTTFNSLCQDKALLYKWTTSELVLPRFIWNPTKAVISVDGYAIELQSVYSMIDLLIRKLKDKMANLFRECPYADAEQYIQSRLDQGHPHHWFRDATADRGDDMKSVLHQEVNQLGCYQNRLLETLVTDPFLFTIIQGQPKPNHSEKKRSMLHACVCIC